MLFIEILGFETLVKTSGYAYIQREAARIRIAESRIPIQKKNETENGDDELKPKLDQPPAGIVHGPRDSFYGQRELIFGAPDGNLLAFGLGRRPVGNSSLSESIRRLSART